MPTFKKLYTRKEKNSTESEGLPYFLDLVQAWEKFKFIFALLTSSCQMLALVLLYFLVMI